VVTAPIVIKLGGRALEREESTFELARALTDLGGPAILIHGGGAELSEWCGRLGIEPRFISGRRVTDPATLEVATAVLAGLANKRLVARLRGAGLDAIGLAAVDAGIAEAVPHADSDALGEVGEIRAVRVAPLRSLLEAGAIPVLASIAACGPRLLNVNADDLAGANAAAIGARALVLLSDVPGVSLGGRTATHLDAAALDRALSSPEDTRGNGPKLAAAKLAIAAGVPCAFITAWSGTGTLAALLSGNGAGTRIGEAFTEALTAPTGALEDRTT
jgi:acetylglutamate kinase